MSEFSEFAANLPPVTSKLLTEEDVDRILAENERNHPEKNLDTKMEPGNDVNGVCITHILMIMPSITIK
jgi:hypothetical protein